MNPLPKGLPTTPPSGPATRLRSTLFATVAALLVAGFAPVAHAQGPSGSGGDPPERLIVLFDTLPPGLQKHDRYNGADVLSVDETAGFVVVQANHGKAFRQGAKDLAGVRGVEPDTVVGSLGFTPNDPMFHGPQYAPKLIGAPAAWSTTTGTSSATLCMLDTGIRRTHQDLAANYVGGIDLVNDDNDPWDDGGHGTRTAGVAAGVLHNGVGIAGIADVPVKAVKVLSSTGGGYSSDIATGIRWCADHGARIVSISLGGSTAVTAVRDAVDYAWGKGLILVAGAGNGNCFDCVLYPAAFPNVIAVGAVDSSAKVQGFTSKGPQVDLAAPGVNIQTTGNGWDTHYLMGGGTSLSAPHVAGAAALVWSAHPTWTNQKVRTALEATAQDVGPAGRDDWSGAGMVRPDRAIAYGSASPPPPSTTTFTASFAVASGSNEWWEEVKVTASAKPSKVEVSANGGPWQSMTLKSWGNWVANVHVAKGTPIVFRATDAAGNMASSPSQPWLGSTTTFTASFAVASGSNEWWEEVKVTSSSAPSKVEFSANGGSWQSMTLKSWGNWVANVHVVKGTPMVFRAADVTGNTASSPSQPWLGGATTTTTSSPSTTTTAPAFAATFLPKSVGNNWWVETAVSANQPVVKVEAKVNGGSYVTLAKQDWGTYAKSIHAPDGSVVTFRATSTTGATATGPPVTWT